MRRAYSSGPFAECLTGLRLKETAAGCAVEFFAHFTPRNAFGKFLARNILGPNTMRAMRVLVSDVQKHLAGQQRVVMSNLTVTAPNATALDAGMEKLRGRNLPCSQKLRDFLPASSDVELCRIRPFTVARKWDADRWDVLRLFLHATRAGLFNLSWEVLCPNCRTSPPTRTASLSQLASAAHCEVCNIKFDAAFDKSVVLRFFSCISPCAHAASRFSDSSGRAQNRTLPARFFSSRTNGANGICPPSNIRSG